MEPDCWHVKLKGCRGFSKLRAGGRPIGVEKHMAWPTTAHRRGSMNRHSLCPSKGEGSMLIKQRWKPNRNHPTKEESRWMSSRERRQLSVFSCLSVYRCKKSKDGWTQVLAITGGYWEIRKQTRGRTMRTNGAGEYLHILNGRTGCVCGGVALYRKESSNITKNLKMTNGMNL